MSQWLSLETADGPIRAWLARPDAPPLGAVVVIQEIFGVNAHIRAVAERFARAGFTAMAPALFDLVQPEVELHYDEAGVSRGRDLAASVGFEAALHAVAAAARWLHEAGHRVGAVGFCWGGTLALLANSRLHLPAVDYYGGRSLPFLGERALDEHALDKRAPGEPPLAPMLFHFGERDALIPPQDIAEHRRHYPDAQCHLYPAGHGFNCEERRDYDPASAALAWERTLAFLREHLS